MSGSRSGVASQPATSGTISFLDLPKRIRNDIYKRVLVVGHPIYLFQDKGSRVETFAPDKPIRWLALLHSNRQIYGEARAVLYGMSRFILVDTTQQQVDLLQSFLDCIGPVNANLLSHLCINFPVAENREDQPCEVKLREDGRQSLRLLQENCTNLTTLETFVHSKNSSFLIGADEDNSQFVREALLRIDAQLKAISSLQRIIVRVYIGTLTPLVKDMMRGLGWVVVFGDR
ncbi:hypothetical protein B0T10DRAFT_409548 [Thelonectria olida]|uniref:Uncharacterized protein n=1 Tax=Thelonectria olida TaxID=1576542 RepID=A0A9P8VYC5_9HYPO|nr:hypothetical protein B0T10DRAFT_409548 [Thelonectria olida]